MAGVAAVERVEVIVIGGGIAGCSLAGALSAQRQVLVLEREAQPAYHASGRSAAIYIEPYSSDPIFALTLGTLPVLLNPPEGFAEAPLLTPRGYLLLAPKGSEAEVDAYLENWAHRCTDLEEISLEAAHGLLPVLRQGYAGRAVYDRNALAMDTHGMIQGYLRQVKAGGGRFQGGAEVVGIEKFGDSFTVSLASGERFEAPVVVNAAGAWASAVGALAGAAPLRLSPLRRSAALISGPEGADVRTWPAVSSLHKSFYFKPEGGELMVSPADETPFDACDAYPDDYDLAVGIARAEECADLKVQRINSSWAGLRTFSDDGQPIYGFDPTLPGFYWCAGQGGTGFQTAAGGAAWCAAEILGAAPPEAVMAQPFDTAAFRPERFA
jgi:D-arginine dehydrogenase